MSQTFFYCSDLSRASGERSFGTASVGEVWLLVEYREAWGTHALEDSALPAVVKRHLNNFCQTVPRARLLFVKRERVRPEPPVCFVVRCRERAPSIERFELNTYEDLLQFDLAALAAGGAPGGVKLETPLYLVCTHGKRDKCCAKFGYALYKSLRAGEASGDGEGEAAGDSDSEASGVGGDGKATGAGGNSSGGETAVDSDVEGGGRIWQSSHVGGDRFAANLVCFPHGLFYAHVTEDAGRRIVAEYAHRRLTLEGYRGRACYSYPVQAAEFFIRTETKLDALDALRYRRHERTGERSWRVTFVESLATTGDGAGARIHEAHVAARPSEFRNYITCGAAEERRVIQYALEDYGVTGGDARVE
ncbi:MAG: hypothetical protein QOD32_1973 [Pyrinomonadaceae bacterium]|jgi:hypothetical protein|nr:hypothetical protein [Pyrinomonadaceae bacterium]